MHLNEIELNKTYYLVTVGNINEVQILEINKPKVKIKYMKSGFVFDEFLTDRGIRYKEENYINDLNSIFRTKEEAENFISTVDYQMRLQEHFLFFKINSWIF